MTLLLLLLACTDGVSTSGGEKPGELLDTGEPPVAKDRDGDGAPDEVDCDADDPTVYPGAPLVCGDDRLNDCDSDLAAEASACAPVAETPITQSEALVLTVSESGIGGTVLNLGDLMGDGEPDLGFPTTDWAVEDGDADGGLLVVEQGSTGASLRLRGVYSAAGALFAGPLGDANGDGFGDLYVAGDCGESAYLVAGPLEADLNLMEEADAAVPVSGSICRVAAGALDSDGTPGLFILRDDVLVIVSDPLGAATSVEQTVSGEYDLGDGYTPFTPDGSGLTALGDTDGDGFPEVSIGLIDARGVDRVQAIGEHDAVSGFEYPIALLSESGAAQFGAAVAGGEDLDGDGYDDVAVGSPEPLSEAAVGGGGRVYLFRGPLSFPLDASAAAATLIGEGALGLAGSAVDLGGDLDGDSLPDLIVGAPAEVVGEGALGRAYVLSGRQSGSVLMAEGAVGSLIGEGALGLAPQVGASVGLLPARSGLSARLLIGAAGAGQAFLLDPNP